MDNFSYGQLFNMANSGTGYGYMQPDSYTDQQLKLQQQLQGHLDMLSPTEQETRMENLIMNTLENELNSYNKNPNVMITDNGKITVPKASRQQLASQAAENIYKMKMKLRMEQLKSLQKVADERAKEREIQRQTQMRDWIKQAGDAKLRGINLPFPTSLLPAGSKLAPDVQMPEGPDMTAVQQEAINEISGIQNGKIMETILSDLRAKKQGKQTFVGDLIRAAYTPRKYSDSPGSKMMIKEFEKKKDLENWVNNNLVKLDSEKVDITTGGVLTGKKTEKKSLKEVNPTDYIKRSINILGQYDAAEANKLSATVDKWQKDYQMDPATLKTKMTELLKYLHSKETNSNKKRLYQRLIGQLGKM